MNSSHTNTNSTTISNALVSISKKILLRNRAQAPGNTDGIEAACAPGSKILQKNSASMSKMIEIRVHKLPRRPQSTVMGKSDIRSFGNNCFETHKFPMNSHLEPGTIIEDRYEITEFVGEGGMGTVLKAKEIGLHRTVAIKFLHTSLIGDDENRTRFEREGKILSSLRHENILLFFRFGFFQGMSPYIAMEFLQGRSLQQVILANGPLPVSRLLRIAIQICNGVGYAHTHGIVHRDLKPGNIILVNQPEEDTVKIVDFGLAKIPGAPHATAPHLTQTGELIGSIHYMSPEQCRGEKTDARSDIYSLGCLLYESLAGAPPLEADTTVGLLHKHTTEMPPPVEQTVKGLPPGIDNLLFRSMAKKPIERYQTMEEMRLDLERIARGQGDEISPAPSRLATKTKNTIASKWVAPALLLIILTPSVFFIQRKVANRNEELSLKEPLRLAQVPRVRSLKALASQVHEVMFKKGKGRLSAQGEELCFRFLARLAETPDAEVSEVDYLDAATYASLLLEHAKNHDKAIKLLQQFNLWCIHKNAGPGAIIRGKLNLARSLCAVGRDREAEQLLIQTITNESKRAAKSDLAQMEEALVLLYATRGQIELATEHHDRFIHHVPVEDEYYGAALVRFLVLLTKSGNRKLCIDRAKPYLRSICTTAKNGSSFSSALAEMVRAASFHKTWSTEVNDFLKEIINSPETNLRKLPGLWLQLGCLYEIQKDYPNALKAYSHAAAGNEEGAEIGKIRCLIHLNQIDLARDIDKLSQSTNHGGSDLGVTRVRGMLINRNDGPDKAIAYLVSQLSRHSIDSTWDQEQTTGNLTGEICVIEQDLAMLYCAVGDRTNALKALNSVEKKLEHLYGPTDESVKITIRQIEMLKSGQLLKQ